MTPREEGLERVRERRAWDIVVIGGGATGLGTAVDAAARGYRTLLLEAHDFAKGTSSRSTKLIHGGVRYLAQGHVGLVREALRERGRLLRNAPHLVHAAEFPHPRLFVVGAAVLRHRALALRPARGRAEPRSFTTRSTAIEALRLAPTLEGRDLRGGRHLSGRPVRRRPARDRARADVRRPGRNRAQRRRGRRAREGCAGSGQRSDRPRRRDGGEVRRSPRSAW